MPAARKQSVVVVAESLSSDVIRARAHLAFLEAMAEGNVAQIHRLNIQHHELSMELRRARDLVEKLGG